MATFVRRNPEKTFPENEISEENTGVVARAIPQTPLQHAQRHGQFRGVAHTPFARERLRRTWPAFVLLLFILTLSLVAYSPVLEFLPGYRTEADRSRESLLQNIIRLDSMERMMNDMMTYNRNIALIMEGLHPPWRGRWPRRIRRASARCW